MDLIPMTIDGAEKLRRELKSLQSVERQKVIQAIAEARAHGDLRENAEYHAAKEQQAFLEGRIRELEHKLTHARVIDVKTLKNDGKVVFGATVSLENVDTDERLTYRIVGDDEANIKLGLLSVSSPLARSIVGKYKDTEVVVRTPKGEVTYIITAVEYK